MSKVCDITGKRPGIGHKVSHSMRHTKRRFMPNLQKRKVFNPTTGKTEIMKISTAGLRNLMRVKKIRTKRASA